MSDRYIGVKLEYHAAPDEEDDGTEHGYIMPPIRYGDNMLIISIDSQPAQVAAELKRMFPVAWWAVFIGAVVEGKRE